MRLKVLILNSHPVQYFAPLYRQLAQDEAFDLTVLYCSRHGLAGDWDRQFGAYVQWDVPLLEGYSYEFIQNAAPRPSIYSFWGLLNLAVITRLVRQPKGVLVIHGWAYAINWVAALAGRMLGHTICLRGESPLGQEAGKQGWRQRGRRFLLRYGLFPCVDYFLYIGKQNRAFYEAFGQPARKLIFTPYCVNNSCFTKQYNLLRNQRPMLRQRLGLPANKTLILYAGKFIAKKRPMDLIQAFHRLGRTDVALVMVGEGELRPDLESYIYRHSVREVYLPGFVNQSAIGEYYASADVYVMCSDAGETWGLATNEAMNFGLPIILAHQVGCVDDLLMEGRNGYSYQTGDVEGLARVLERFLNQEETTRKVMGAYSRERVSQYSYAVTIASLKHTLTHENL